MDSISSPREASERAYDALERGLIVLKMRGSPHDYDIHQFEIDGVGMHIDPLFRKVGGIMAGHSVDLELVG